jgi:hypothetical protein
VPNTVSKPPSALQIGTLAAVALLLTFAPLVAILSAIARQNTCHGTGGATAPSAHAQQGIPATYLTLYRRAGREYGVPWQLLAGIGSIETDHGRSSAPGVRSGVNGYGCCAGPMQFNTRYGPPSTWDRFGVDGDHDGTRNIYDPADAIPSAANYLRTLLRNADGNLGQAVFGYNHSQAYVNDVLARARVYAGLTERELAAPIGDPTVLTGCADGGLDARVGPANLYEARRVTSPRAFRALPTWAMAAGRAPQLVDARIHQDVIWILRRYHLLVTAGREAGHHTHATAPPSTSPPPTAPPKRPGTPPPADSPATWAGPKPAHGPARAPPARSYPRSSSSATTATPATAHHAPAPAAAPRTSISPGPHRATAAAPSPHRARRSWRSPRRHRHKRPCRGLSSRETGAVRL